jgi:hypothetical protein
MARDGTFVDEMFWQKHEFIPKGIYGNIVQGYFDNTDSYGNTSPYIAAEIAYNERSVILMFIPDADDGKSVPDMSAQELVKGDSFLELYYTPDKWARFVERFGSFEDMQARLEELPEPSQNGGKRRIRCARRATRKGKRSKRRGTRKHH